jgi:hypothetical protein
VSNLSPQAQRTIQQYGVRACHLAWVYRRQDRLSLAHCAIESGIPTRSIEAAVEAFDEFQKDLKRTDPDQHAARFGEEGGRA